MYVGSTFIFNQLSTLKQRWWALTINVASTWIQHWCVCWLAITKGLKLLHRLNLGKIWIKKLQKKENQLAGQMNFAPNELSHRISLKLAERREEVVQNFILIIHFNHSLSIFVPKPLLSLVYTGLVTRNSKPYPASLTTRFWV